VYRKNAFFVLFEPKPIRPLYGENKIKKNAFFSELRPNRSVHGACSLLGGQSRFGLKRVNFCAKTTTRCIFRPDCCLPSNADVDSGGVENVDKGLRGAYRRSLSGSVHIQYKGETESRSFYYRRRDGVGDR